ncbi:hypothetical protein BGX38DRAFT_1157640 [Terfezia claveryi]|nr:hypothetical protein BGX38DRAFT_1157640 [Terfezia claveryi]
MKTLVSRLKLECICNLLITVVLMYDLHFRDHYKRKKTIDYSPSIPILSAVITTPFQTSPCQIGSPLLLIFARKDCRKCRRKGGPKHGRGLQDLGNKDPRFGPQLRRDHH